MSDTDDGREAGSLEGGNRPAAVKAVSVPTHDPTELKARVATVYQQHGDELLRFIFGVVRDPEQAKDVLQATLAKALERGQEAHPETFKGWLFRVAFHEALANRRRVKTGEKVVRRLSELGRVADALPDLSLQRSETAKAVRQALDKLPASQRKVVVARIYDDKPFARIADESGVPLGTVLTRMRLALDKLRRALRADH